MRFGSLFTGIGGLDLGLERAGMECAWQVEIDDYATRVLGRHWPGLPRWKDVREFINDIDQSRWEPLEVDLICGGFPCQPVSLAGSRRGDSDERWLWPAFRRVINILDSSYVVIENVPGLISADAGRIFRGILRDLSQSGYDAEWQTLPAAAFGAPHLRERLFIVAYSREKHRRQGITGKRFGQADFGTAGDSNQPRLPQRQGERSNASEEQPPTIGADWRAVTPTVRRGDHGIPHRVDRLRGLGNAVVPQVAEWIGRRILAYDQATCYNPLGS